MKELQYFVTVLNLMNPESFSHACMHTHTHTHTLTHTRAFGCPTLENDMSI